MTGSDPRPGYRHLLRDILAERLEYWGTAYVCWNGSCRDRRIGLGERDPSTCLKFFLNVSRGFRPSCRF